jgi:hypothetical protein
MGLGPIGVLITDIQSEQLQSDADAFYGGPTDFSDPSQPPTAKSAASTAVSPSTGVSPWLWALLLGAGLLFVSNAGKK